MGTDANIITDFDNKKAFRVVEVTGVVNHPNEGSYVVDVDGKKALAVVVLDGGGGSGDMTKVVYDPAAINEQLVGLTASQTLTNKTIDADNSTITNIGATEVKADIITGQSLVVALAGDQVLITDDSDSDNLKRVNVADFLGGASLELYKEKPNSPTITTPTVDNTVFIGQNDLVYLDEKSNIGINNIVPLVDLPPNMTGTPDVVKMKNFGNNNNMCGFLMRAGNNEDIGIDIWSQNNSGDTFIDHRWTSATRGIHFRMKTSATLIEAMFLKGTGVVNMGAMPTSSAGLVAGDLWNNSNVVNII